MLAFIFAVLADVSPKPYTYHVKPTGQVYQIQGYPSCGATRLKKDRYTVRIYAPDKVTVNSMRWQPEKNNDIPPFGVVELSYHVNPGVFTYLWMTIFIARDGVVGHLTLVGRTEDRRMCVDRIELEGKAQ